MQPKDKRHYKQDAGTNSCNSNSHWLLLGSSHCSSSRRSSATATLTRSQRLTRSSAIISRTTTQSVRIRCLVSLHPRPRNQPLQTAGGSLAIDQIGGGGGIRTLGTWRRGGFQDRCFQPLNHPSEKSLSARGYWWAAV